MCLVLVCYCKYVSEAKVSIGHSDGLLSVQYQAFTQTNVDLISIVIMGAMASPITSLTIVYSIACRLFGAKPLPEPVLTYCQFDSWGPISLKYERNSMIFILKNVLKIVVCQNGGHVVRERRVNSLRPSDAYMRH